MRWDVRFNNQTGTTVTLCFVCLLHALLFVVEFCVSVFACILLFVVCFDIRPEFLCIHGLYSFLPSLLWLGVIGYNMSYKVFDGR